MKKFHYAGLVLAGSALFTSAASAESFETNRFTFSARFGFNISAKFKDIGRVSLNGISRATPNGHNYNYDDGYVLEDVSGNFGDQTWYWGYDDSARQISGDTILMSRSSSAGNFESRERDDDPTLGAELVYNRQLGVKGKLHWGIEAAANYLDFSSHDNRSINGSLAGVTDAYSYTPGTTPPTATPGNSYQGTLDGPGFVIGATPVSSTASLSSATLSGKRELNADIWGFRLGPYLEYPITENLNVSLSGGFAFALLNAEAKWNETLATPGANYSLIGKGQDCGALWGGYVAANLAWQFSERWSAVGGIQYQDLGTFDESIGGRGVEIDLSSSIFLTVGLGYSF